MVQETTKFDDSFHGSLDQDQCKTGTVYPYLAVRPGQRSEILTFSPLYSEEHRFYRLSRRIFDLFKNIEGVSALYSYPKIL